MVALLFGGGDACRLLGAPNLSFTTLGLTTRRGFGFGDGAGTGVELSEISWIGAGNRMALTSRNPIDSKTKEARGNIVLWRC